MAKTNGTKKIAGGNLPLVIVNPLSAGGSTGDKWPGIASDLRTHFGPFNVEFTDVPRDGIRLAREGAEAGRKFIIACGGDGTINEVANGILDSGKDVELGVLPSGTGGDFRRSIQMPESSRDAALALKNGRTRTIDVGRITFQNFNDETETRYFLNVSSFGLAASIIDRVKTSTSLNWLPLDAIRGPASFALSTLQEVFELETIQLLVRIDGRKEKPLVSVNFCVANARYFGGGMMIAPEAKLADGFLDVINVGDINSARILLHALSLYRGTHLDLPEVKGILAKRIEVRPQDEKKEVDIEIDGELPGKLPAIYEVVPNALKLCVP